MNIIFDRAAAEELGKKYTVLELETFAVNDRNLECFCLVDGEKLTKEMHTLERSCKLHAKLVSDLKRKDYDAVEEILGHLYGKFGGELDSFYQVILERIKAQKTT